MADHAGIPRREVASVKRLVVIAAAALLVAACGSEDENKQNQNHEDPTPQPPTFAGVDEVRSDAPDTAAVFFLPATDDLTPAEELQYKVHIWETNPASGDVTSQTRDVPAATLSNCAPRCRWNYTGLLQNDVKWFAMEVTDGDGMKAGIEKVGPAVIPGGAPHIDSISSSTVAVGDTVQLSGGFFLSERLGDDSLTINGEPIPATFIDHWDNVSIHFRVPNGMDSGTLAVKTPAGEAQESLTITAD